jgi:hypothetical protein
MSAYGQTESIKPLLGIAVPILWWALCSGPAMADEHSANPTSMSFAAGGTIRMKLNVGDVEVVGAQHETITVSWHARDADDERDVSVKLLGSGTKDARLVLDGPGNHVQYRIEVPQRSNVSLDMNAGDLSVRGILGNLEAELLAGEIDLRVADPAKYRSVSAAVTVGEIDAPPWKVNLEGLGRSFRVTADGEYDLRARLLAGQITIRSE